MLRIGGNNLQMTPIFPYFQDWGDEVRPQFFHVSKSSQDQKKGLHQKLKSFFPRDQVKTKKKSKDHPALRCKPKSNSWGDAVKLLGGEDISPRPPGVSATLSIVIKLLAYPLGLCSFLKAIMPYTVEQNINFQFILLFCQTYSLQNT